jgi:hypothetical protein
LFMSAILSDYYQRAVAMFETGRLEESLEHFEKFLEERPGSGKAWNGAGTVLFRLGQHEKAAQYFRYSMEQEDRPAEVWRNLICTYLVLAKPAKAMKLLKTVDHEVHADIPLVCRTAGVFQQQSDLASAMGILQFGKRLEGQMSLLTERIEQLRAKRAKVTFFSGGVDMKRLNAIVEYMQQRYPVRVYEGRNATDIHDLMQWSDICWFEGCGEVTETGTRGPLTCKTIVRLCDFEAADERPETVHWQNVDVLVTTGNPQVLQGAEQRCPGLGKRVSVVTIPYGVDVDRIAFKRRGRGHKIAVAGVGKMDIEIMQCVSELLRRDSEFELHHLADLGDRAFQEEVDFIVSAGDTEAVQSTVLEAMACGVKPVVRDFPGGREIFGRNYLFSTPEEFCGKILEADYDSEEYRVFVEQKYPLCRQLMQIDELIAGYEAAGSTFEAAAEMLSTEAVSGAV